MSDFPNDDLPGDDSLDEDGPSIEASSEMEDALREATQAVEARRTSAEEADDGAGSPDKLTIELLSDELQELKGLYEGKLKEFDEQNEPFLRLQAEFENFRRRKAIPLFSISTRGSWIRSNQESTELRSKRDSGTT